MRALQSSETHTVSPLQTWSCPLPCCPQGPHPCSLCWAQHATWPAVFSVCLCPFHSLITAVIYLQLWGPEHINVYLKPINSYHTLKWLKSLFWLTPCPPTTNGFDLSVQTRSRWCSALPSRAAVDQKQDMFDFNQLCDKPDTHSGPGPDRRTRLRLRSVVSPAHCTVPFSTWIQCCSLELFYYHLVSTNSARDAEWCKPKQSAECG